MKPFEEELHNIIESPDFLNWLRVLSGMKKGTEFPKSFIVSKELLISGYCEDVASYLHFKYGLKIAIIDSKTLRVGHYFIEDCGKFYDAMDPGGVSRPSELQFFKRYSKICPAPEVIDSCLRYDWDSPETYMRHASFFKNLA